MKKDTLIKVIDEEFGDGQPLSWLVDVVRKALTKNDSRIAICTKQYEEQTDHTFKVLDSLYDDLKRMESIKDFPLPRPRENKKLVAKKEKE